MFVGSSPGVNMSVPGVGRYGSFSGVGKNGSVPVVVGFILAVSI